MDKLGDWNERSLCGRFGRIVDADELVDLGNEQEDRCRRTCIRCFRRSDGRELHVVSNMMGSVLVYTVA